MTARSAVRGWVVPVPGESRALTAAVAVVVTCGVVIGVATSFAWQASARGATTALIGGIVALGLACAASAGYVIWLRARVNHRMAAVLRRYLPAPPVAVSER